MSTLLSGLEQIGPAAFAVAGLLAMLAAFAIWFYARREGSRAQQRFEALATTNRRNQAIVEGAGEGVLELDNVGLVRYANPAAAKLLGYELEELAGIDYRVLINDDAGKGDPVRRVRYTTDIMRGVGALLRRKDGQLRPVEYRIVPVTEQGRSVGTVLVFQDVTERVRVDNLLKDMQATAKIGGWEYDVVSGKTRWTEAVYALHELPPNHPISLESTREFCRPEDQERLTQVFRRALDNGTPGELQLLLNNARGQEIWVRLLVKVERRGGKTVRLHGTYQDVTDLVVAEQQLRETRDFFELTLNAVPTPVTFVNQQSIITYANRALEEWFGRSQSELVGKSIREVLPRELDEELVHHMAGALRGEPGFLTQAGVRNGRPREWQNHFVPQLAPNGEVLGFFSILYDLTETKRQETRLKE
jgi:PAS domain S-box-containing protein